MVGERGFGGEDLRNLEEQLMRRGSREETKTPYTQPPAQQPTQTSYQTPVKPQYSPEEIVIRSELEAITLTQPRERQYTLAKEFFARHRIGLDDYRVCMQCYASTNKRSGMFYAKRGEPPIRPEAFDGLMHAVYDMLAGSLGVCGNHTLKLKIGKKIRDNAHVAPDATFNPLTDAEVVALTKEEEFQNLDYLSQTLEAFGLRDYKIVTHREKSLRGEEIGEPTQVVVFYNLQLYATQESRRERISRLRMFDKAWTMVNERLTQGELDAEQLRTLIPRFLEMIRERQLL